MQTETESRTDAVFKVVGSPLPARLKLVQPEHQLAWGWYYRPALELLITVHFE